MVAPCGAAVLLLAGCGGSESGEPTTGSDVEAKPQSESEEGSAKKESLGSENKEKEDQSSGTTEGSSLR